MIFQSINHKSKNFRSYLGQKVGHPPDYFVSDELLKLSKGPNPSFFREEVQILDGEWQFAYDFYNKGIEEKFYQRGDFPLTIKVPFPPQSSASGINDPNTPKVIWYGKRFSLGKDLQNGENIFLNFGAVDYKADVYLNGNYLGEHKGGYTPFSFEIKKYLKPVCVGEQTGGEDNLLIVRVEDPFTPYQVRGKQSPIKRPFLVFYRGISGIWQSVWLEKTGKVYLLNYKIFTDLDKKRIRFLSEIKGENGKTSLNIEITTPAGEKISQEISWDKKEEKEVYPGGCSIPPEVKEIEFALPDVYPWSPSEPNLYLVEFTLRQEGKEEDKVKSYFGIRKIEAKGGKIYLNNKILYQKLILNQGYYPGGFYTPEDFSVFKRDVALIKECGFNGVRMHQKIENKKFLFWCDCLGILVWEEMPSCYWIKERLKPEFEKEWDEVRERDFNHPSIIVLVPFNESWGVMHLLYSKKVREYVKRIYLKTKERENNRLVIDNSGFDHIKTDILDVHHYLGKLKRSIKFYEELKDKDKIKFTVKKFLLSLNPAIGARPPLAPGGEYNNEPIIISEYGGFGYYRAMKKPLLCNFREYTEAIAQQEHIVGFAYTQFYDVEQEKNGLFTFNREPKIPILEIKKVNEMVDKYVKERYGDLSL